MSLFGRTEPSQSTTPEPSTVVAEPASPQACAADYAGRSNTTAAHPGSYDAQPHTHGRKP